VEIVKIMEFFKEIVPWTQKKNRWNQCRNKSQIDCWFHVFLRRSFENGSGAGALLCTFLRRPAHAPPAHQLCIFVIIWARASVQLFRTKFDWFLRFGWVIWFSKASIPPIFIKFPWVYFKKVKKRKKQAKTDQFRGWNVVFFPWKWLLYGQYLTQK